MSDAPQQIWDDYYARIRQRRMKEARILYLQMVADGVTDDMVLALDFVHFGDEREQIERLAEQLSENYAVTISQRSGSPHWDAHGTTRPDGIDGISEEEWCDWAAFMCDVAQSYGCVFSTWTLNDPLRQKSWSNETIEVDID